MSVFSCDDAPVEIRADLREAQAGTWARIAAPGTWFDAKTRGARHRRLSVAHRRRLRASR